MPEADLAAHFGELHGLEGFAVLLLLLGPLVVAVATVFYIRWRDEQEEPD